MEENTIVDEDFIKNTTTTITIFGENALKTSAQYISHGKRKIITREDVKRALIHEMFIFNKRELDIKHFKNVKKDLFENDEDEKSGINTPNYIVDNTEETFSLNGCNCKLCDCIKNIYDEWEVWEPSTPFENIFQKHINNI